MLIFLVSCKPVTQDNIKSCRDLIDPDKENYSIRTQSVIAAKQCVHEYAEKAVNYSECGLINGYDKDSRYLRDECLWHYAMFHSDYYVCGYTGFQSYQTVNCYYEIALSKNDTKACDEIPDNYTGTCYGKYAVNLQNFSICDDLVDKDDCYMQVVDYVDRFYLDFTQYEALKICDAMDNPSSCYFNLAMAFENESICEYLPADSESRKECKWMCCLPLDYSTGHT